MIDGLNSPCLMMQSPMLAIWAMLKACLTFADHYSFELLDDADNVDNDMIPTTILQMMMHPIHLTLFISLLC